MALECSSPLHHRHLLSHQLPAASTGADLLLLRQGWTGTLGARPCTGLSRTMNCKTQKNLSVDSGRRSAVMVPDGRWAGRKESYE